MTDPIGPQLAAGGAQVEELAERLEELAAQLRARRERLERLRREGTGAEADVVAAAGAALDEIESILELVRGTRLDLARLEGRLVRRFDGLVARLHQAEREAADPL